MSVSKKVMRVICVLTGAMLAAPAMVGHDNRALSADEAKQRPPDPVRLVAPEPIDPIFWTLEPETPSGRPMPAILRAQRATSPPTVVNVGPYVSRQVSIDGSGNNVVGDAANEPSMAIDPTNPNKIAIGWRQFDTISDQSAFRQAGVAYSTDGGLTWTSDVLDPGQFRSDPVLGSDGAGNFYYSSLSTLTTVEMFKSTDGGQNWSATPPPAHGGDKQWMTVDATAGPGAGFVYQNWNVQFTCCFNADFTRSVDGGASFESPIGIRLPKQKWGTLYVGPDGDLYLAGTTLNQNGHVFARSVDAQNSAVTPSFDLIQSVDLGGIAGRGGINPAGLTGQVWVATDHSTTATRGNVYILASVNPTGDDPLDVMFIRSTDRGESWSAPVRVNDDGATNAWQWFGAMSVAPNGRIDVTWNDTRNDTSENTWSEVFYSFSLDGGRTWSTNIPVSPPFDPRLGYPADASAFQNKMGDYTHMISDNGGAGLAHTATHNGGEDVYYLYIPTDCDNNGTSDADELTGGATDCNNNEVPDNCEPDEDCDANGTRDICDIGAGASDCNQNRIPDICEPDFDCNGNEVQDICDVTNGTSRDENHDDVPDECEAKFSQPPDDNGEDITSNLDLTSFDFNVVAADDFVSNGRPITGVRWWGSHLPEPSVTSGAVATSAGDSPTQGATRSSADAPGGGPVEGLVAVNAVREGGVESASRRFKAAKKGDGKAGDSVNGIGNVGTPRGQVVRVGGGNVLWPNFGAKPLIVHRSRTTGLAMFVTAADRGAIPVQVARGKQGVEPLDFFTTHGNLFGITNPNNQLQVEKVQVDSLGNTHTTYQETHKGVSVFGGVVKVHQDAGGAVFAANGDFFPIPDRLNTVPRLTGEEAAAKAKVLIDVGAPAVEHSKLVIVDPGWYGNPPKGAHLAYYIILADLSVPVREAFFVDAHRGNILDQWNLVHTIKDRTIYNDLTEVFDRLEGEAATGDPEVDAVYDYTGDTYDYLFRAFGRDSYDDAGGTMAAIVHLQSGSCPNAFGGGGFIWHCDGVTSDDVVAHEWGHSITGATAGLMYRNQPGQLNESYSDVWGEMIDLLNGDVSLVGTPGGTPWPTPGDYVGPGTDTPNLARTGCNPTGVALDVNAPVSIAGTYLAGPAFFGPTLDETGVTGDVGLAEPADACTTITNPGAISGKIALVNRGACFFSTKVANAVDAGATAVIVVNNVPDGVIGMSPGTGDVISIPSVMITQADGASIRATIEGATTVNVTMRAQSPDSVRWMLCEDCSGFGGAIRDMWEPTCKGHPDRAFHPFQVCHPADNGGVHSGSGIPNHAFAMLSDGKSFNGYTINPIGLIKAGAVWYHALTNYLGVVSDFEDAYVALNQSAVDLFNSGVPIKDPRDGSNFDLFTAGDVVEVDKALRAVEMNTEGLCGAASNVVNTDPPVICAGATTIYSDDFESGTNGWAVSNTGPPTPYDWVQTTGLPDSRPGAAWFVEDRNVGDCGDFDESAVHSLISPAIVLPSTLPSPTLAFTHTLDAEWGWDGGNVSISVDGGAFLLIPGSAFEYNPYNEVLLSSGISTNPLAGQEAWTGFSLLGGGWGTSLIDLSGYVSGGETVRFVFDFGKDCGFGGPGWWVDDFEIYTCAAAGASKMYFGDSGIKKIQRSDVDGSNVEDLVTFTNVSPESLALDLDGGKMYWTEGWFNKIQRSDLDGSNVEDLVTTNLPAPNGIALDLNAGKIYWTDSSNDSIRRTDLDGTNLEVLITSAQGLDAPHAIALDVGGGKIYWTDRNTFKIHRANLDGTGVEVVLNEGGLVNNFGIALDVPAGKMYWTTASAKKIRRADLDGSNMEDLVITDLSFPGDIALDLAIGKMYWTDWGNDTIKRADLDGNNVESLITTGLDTPRALALGLAPVAPPPSGDTCNEAIEIVSLPYSTTGNTCASADDYDELCPSDTPGSADIVYKYTPSSSGYVKISLCDNSAYDTKVYVYANVCGAYQSGTSVACSDDTCESPLNPWVSHISAVFMASGSTYYIVVDGYGGDCGDYTLDVTETGPPPPDPSCASDAMVSQPASRPDGWWSANFSDSDIGWLAYDTIKGVTQRITHAKWWGFELSWDGARWVTCDDPTSFEIKFYEDSGGAEPGSQVCSTYLVAPSRVDTGHEYFPAGAVWNLWEYEADFGPGCALGSGWVSIQAIGGDSSCFFAWVGSEGGDISSLQEDVGAGEFYYRNPSRAVCLSGTVPRPDGWLISFHKHLTTSGSTDEPALGLYFCDASVVGEDVTTLGSCDGEIVLEYETSLADCCLLDQNLDTRTDVMPAQADAFNEERCLTYDIDIQAVIGKRYVDDGEGGCVEEATGNLALFDFWGVHTSSVAHGVSFGLRSALESFLLSGPIPGQWLYNQPWSLVTPACSSQPNLAFELLTTDTGSYHPDGDNNGVPDFCEHGQIVYVDAAPHSGGIVAAAVHDGKSWDTAYLFLQDALDTAMLSPSVEEIWMAAGKYVPTDKSCVTDSDCAPTGASCILGKCVWSNGRVQSFHMKSGLGIYGGFPSAASSPLASERDELSDRNPELYETILSGDNDDDDPDSDCCLPHGAPGCDDAACETAVCASRPSCCSTEWDATCALEEAISLCGGICTGGNNFENSYHVVTGSGTDDTAIMDGCTITAGNADGVFPDNRGGGMVITGGSPIVRNCIFRRNQGGFGGGLDNRSSSATVVNCKFIDNNAAFVGGGIEINATGTPLISNCTFKDNTAGNGAGLHHNGSGIPLIVNCTFTANAAENVGGGMSNVAGDAAVANCIFSNNTDNGGANMDESAQIDVFAGTVTVSYSLIQGLSTFTGAGNIDADPLFADPFGGDLRLADSSPAIDAGDTTAVPADAADLDGDSNTAERTPLDLANMLRVLDDPNTPDTGVAGSAVVDMGAYEFVPDCNGNGIPDLCDEDCLALGGDCALIECGGGLDEDEDEIIDCVESASSGSFNWTDTSTWGGGPVPDCGTGFCGAHVTMDAGAGALGGALSTNRNEQEVMLSAARLEVLVDKEIDIDSLTLRRGAIVKGGFAPLGGASGVQSEASLLVTRNLLIRDFILNEGSIHLRYGWTVDLVNEGPCTVGPGGKIRKDPDVSAFCTAQVITGDLTVRPDPCPDGACGKGGGLIELRDEILVDVRGKARFEGTLLTSSVGAVAGGQTPPTKLLMFGADLASGQGVSSSHGFGGTRLLCRGFELTPGDTIILNEGEIFVEEGGDFDNKSTRPGSWDWTKGGLRMSPSSTAANAAAEQITSHPFPRFEVGGIDLGKDYSPGALTDEDAHSDTRPHSNFSIKELRIAQANTAASSAAILSCGVDFVNEFSNTVGNGPCQEAGYFANCIFETGCTVTLKNVNIYCQNIESDGATIIEEGCGTLQMLGATVDPLLAGPNPWDPDPLGGDLNRTGSFEMPVTAAGNEVAIRVKVVDMYVDTNEDASGCPVRATELPDLSLCDGDVQYLGAPAAFDDNDVTVTPKFVAAKLQDTPHYMDWSPSALTTLLGAGVDTDTIYYYGNKVLPCSVYDVQQGTQTCVESAAPEGCLSTPLVVKTALWGDVWEPFGNVNFTDIGQVVDAWKSISFVEAGPGGAPRKVRAMLRDVSVPLDTKINFTDIGEVVDAWKKIAYQRDCQ